MRHFESEFRPVVVTDSLEMVRSLRAAARAPFILYVAPLDDTAGRNRVTATMLNATGD